MNTTQKRHNWNERIMPFNNENIGRPTRLGVFESIDGGLNDYWLEDGLPLKGVSFEDHSGKTSAEIFFDGFTHFVENAQRIELIYGTDGRDDGLNIVDADGKTSRLRFE